MQVVFQQRGRGVGDSEREKLLLVWDSFLQSQEIQVEYSMSSTDSIIIILNFTQLGTLDALLVDISTQKSQIVSTI